MFNIPNQPAIKALNTNDRDNDDNDDNDLEGQTQNIDDGETRDEILERDR